MSVVAERPCMVEQNGHPVPVIWQPQPGSQTAYLACPLEEVLYEGTRGPGKTDALLMDFCQHVGQGFGADWSGVLFRRTYPELSDVIAKSLKWFKQIWPQAEYNQGKSQWEWPGGERLAFRQFAKPIDYWKFHGHGYPFIAWEELTTWPDEQCFKSMFSCLRSTHPNMPRKMRATTNPYGVGHNWVKKRYRLPVPSGELIGAIIDDSRDDVGELEPARVAVHGYLDENQILMRADPNYKQRVRAAARNKSELEAWLNGSWDIVAGGMIDDVWDRKIHVVEPFKIPAGWLVDRVFDWGSSKPFSLGWWAESDGNAVPAHNGTAAKVYPKGTLFRIAEWYGWNGKDNEGLRMLAVDIARTGLKMEQDRGYRVQAGPADPSIFAAENGVCIGDDMGRMGMRFDAADAGPGSRKNGAERVRKYLQASKKWPMEEPGLFIFDTCPQWLRTVPTIPRDLKDLDDVDCLVAGTLVETSHGPVAIENIKVGDQVITPIGPRRVLRSNLSGTAPIVSVQLSNGRRIEGTEDHCVFTYQHGLIPLGALMPGMTLAERESWSNRLRTTVLRIVDMMAETITNLGRAFLPQVARVSIDKSGSIIMDQSHRDSTSTILTTIPTITTLTIWSRNLEQNMREGTFRSVSVLEGISASSSMLGDEAMPGKPRFGAMLRKCMRVHLNGNFRALIVVWLLERNTPQKSIVREPVRKRGIWPSVRNYVQSAGRCFRSKLMRLKKSGLVVISVAGPCGDAAVYNLTVEQAHLFYANGALVSNTESEDHAWDETRYRCMFKRKTVSQQKLVGV